jgi:hypothetical protein
MIVSPDFLQLFEATAYLLNEDPTLWCVSSWNDNGFPQFVRVPLPLVILSGSDFEICRHWTHSDCSAPGTSPGWAG